MLNSQTRHITKLFVFLISATILAGCGKNKTIVIAENSMLKISVVNSDQTLWEYKVLKTGKTFSFQAPEFEIDGKLCRASLTSVKLEENPLKLKNGVTEYIFDGKLKELPDLLMRTTLQVSKNNPIVKFRYELSGKATHKLTKAKGRDQIN